MSNNFIPPSPEAMLIDMESEAYRLGKEYDENKARDYVNWEFESNGWKHPDYPLPLVENPVTFAADARRAEAIRRDDQEAMSELERIKARSAEADSRSTLSRLRENSEMERLRRENEELRLALEGQRDAAPPNTPPPAPAARDGEPTTDWSLVEIAEYASAKGVDIPYPVNSPQLRTFGKAALISHINEALAIRAGGGS